MAASVLFGRFELSGAATAFRHEEQRVVSKTPIALLRTQYLATPIGARDQGFLSRRDVGSDTVKRGAAILDAFERGEHSRSVELASEAVAISCETGDGRNAAWALELAAEAARASGDTPAAVRYEADAAELLVERGMPISPWRRPA